MEGSGCGGHDVAPVLVMVRFAVATLTPLVSVKDVALGDGVHLRCAEQGPASGPALILLHGYSDSSLSFSRVMPLLPQGLRVIAPDLRGHGHSARPANGYRIGDLAQDVIEMMDRLDVPEATILGHSMGSFVANAVAERAPKRVSKLILLGSGAATDTPVLRQLRVEVDSLSDPVDDGFVRAFQYSTVEQPVPSEFMEAVIANSRRMPVHVWKKVLQGLIEYRPLQPRPDVPTLVLGGTRDSVFSVDEQTALAGEFPNAGLRLVDGIGHTLHWEQPERFVAIVLNFLK